MIHSSIIYFSPVSDCDDNDRAAFLIEYHPPIADSKPRPFAAFESLHIAFAAGSKFPQTSIDALADLRRELDPLSGACRRKHNRLHAPISRYSDKEINSVTIRSDSSRMLRASRRIEFTACSRGSACALPLPSPAPAGLSFDRSEPAQHRIGGALAQFPGAADRAPQRLVRPLRRQTRRPRSPAPSERGAPPVRPAPRPKTAPSANGSMVPARGV